MEQYPKSVKYLESFVDYEKSSGYAYKKSLRLARMRSFLRLLGEPQKELRVIHIAGSKGKGSTAAFTAYILREAGFRTGLYTSPHLSDFRERIRILLPRSGTVPKRRGQSTLKDRGQSPKGGDSPLSKIGDSPLSNSPLSTSALVFEGMIPKKEMVRLVRCLKPAIKKYRQSPGYGSLSFFEVYTALAFLYFKRRKVDFAVLETGLGGRLDATNTARPLVSAITPISYEHTRYLGESLKQIAAEKAGIIKKRGGVVICSSQPKEALAVIKDKCRKMNAPLYMLGRDIRFSQCGENFCIKGMDREYRGLRVRLPGRHQLINAGVAVGIVDGLRSLGFEISVDSVKRGLYNTLWPGRCEVVLRRPLVVLDGAQNRASAAVLKKAVQAGFSYRHLILIFGASSDKDIKGMALELYKLADTVILTRADTFRAAEPEGLEKYFRRKQTHITHSVREAKELALKIAGKEDLILVTGSLYVVGELRKAMK